MVRWTSKKAYKEIKESGLLSKRRMELYEIIYQNGPLTATEAASLLKTAGRMGRVHNACARIGELKAMSVVKEIGHRESSISGKTSILWATTSNLPVKTGKRKKLEEKVNTAKERYLKLKRKLDEYDLLKCQEKNKRQIEMDLG